MCSPLHEMPSSSVFSSKKRASLARKIFQLMREHYEQSKRLNFLKRYHALKKILTTATSDRVIKGLGALSKESTGSYDDCDNFEHSGNELDDLFICCHVQDLGNSCHCGTQHNDNCLKKKVEQKSTKFGRPFAYAVQVMAKLGSRKKKNDTMERTKRNGIVQHHMTNVNVPSIVESLSDCTNETDPFDEDNLMNFNSDINNSTSPSSPYPVMSSLFSDNSLSLPLESWFQTQTYQQPQEDTDSAIFDLMTDNSKLTASSGDSPTRPTSLATLIKPHKDSTSARSPKVSARPPSVRSPTVPVRSPSTKLNRDMEVRIIRSDQIPEFQIPISGERKRRASRRGPSSPEVQGTVSEENHKHLKRCSVVSEVSVPVNVENRSKHVPKRQNSYGNTDSTRSRHRQHRLSNASAFSLGCANSLSPSPSGEISRKNSDHMSYSTLETVRSEETFFSRAPSHHSLNVFTTEMDEVNIKIACDVLLNLRQEFEAIKGKNILWQYREMKRILKAYVICVII